jgi:phenylacetate-CoA ligase
MGMSIWLRKKLSGISIPIWAGQCLALIPYELRPGMVRAYQKSKRMISSFEKMENWQKKEWIFHKVKDIVDYAKHHIPFYADHYQENGFDVSCLRSYEDIKRIPVINKEKLLSYELNNRSNLDKPGYLVNTGGTSGTPLGLYIHPDHLGNEWSHMHHIWGKLGFSPKDLKLMLMGRSEFNSGLYYDFLRHSLSISIYADIDQIVPSLGKIIRRYQPKFIHGYPSALYEFGLACKERYPDLQSLLRDSLQGGFLGSEYPVKIFRETIEDVFQISTISWYGHTERCILAYEKEAPFIYYPFQTYGYAEVIEDDSGENTLIGTSYYNRTSPLIRYDTEDQVANFERDDGLLSRFEIKEGRRGEFILDKNGKKIPLTGLIFGRHHELFNYCTHIQIYQEGPGSATVLFVPVDKNNVPNPQDLFDSKNVNIEFDFKMLDEPVRTPTGKVKLIVEDESYQR